VLSKKLTLKELGPLTKLHITAGNPAATDEAGAVIARQLNGPFTVLV